MKAGSLIAFQPQEDSLTYEPFFGLKEKAFSLNSDPRFLYHSATHAATFENLLGGIRRREGLLVLTGEIGTGKTMLCRAVLRNLGRKTFSSFVPDPFASREDLLKMLLVDFGVMSIEDLTTGPLKHASRTELSYLLSRFLESVAALDVFVVVIIDEAQNMSLPLIEETRILSDAAAGKGHLQIVFVGQPELHAKLKLPEMRQVDQRVCGYTRLAPLSHDAVAGYVQHRLHVAGGSRGRALFAPEVIELLHRRSGGVPRLINRICDRALQLAHQRNASAVDREILETALIDLGPITLTPTWASIISAEPEGTEPRACARSEATATPAEPVAPPVAGNGSFSARVDEWLTQELAPTVRSEPTLLPPFVDDTSAAPPSAEEPSANHQTLRRLVIWRDAHGELTPETYMQRLGRVWVKRVAIAVVCFAALNAAEWGAAHLPGRLTNLIMDAPQPPAPPAQPTLAVPSVVAAVTPPIEASPAVVSGDYLVAVGLFANPERATRLVEALTHAGLPAGLRPFQLRRQQVQQVVLGPFDTRADAVADLHRLRQLGGYDDANVFDTLPEPSSR